MANSEMPKFENPASDLPHLSGGAGAVGERHFTVEKSSVNVTGGRYSGAFGKSKPHDTPGKAAERAASKLFRNAKAKGMKVMKIKFSLREMTRGSAKKVYMYEAEEMKLDKPKEIKRGDVVTLVTTVRKVRSIKSM